MPYKEIMPEYGGVWGGTPQIAPQARQFPLAETRGERAKRSERRPNAVVWFPAIARSAVSAA